MKNTFTRISLLSALFAFSLSSCEQKDDPIPEPVVETGKVHLEFYNKVGNDNLVLNTSTYTNQAGNQFKVSKFNYYISNIKFNKENGGQFAETESYHLLQQSDETTLTFDVSNVPNGTYKSVTFMIGVDSTRNVSGAHTGALDPGNNMYWTWSTGYIMLKMEGTSADSPEPGDMVEFHIGGFSGTYSSLRTVTLAFPQDLVINGNTNHLHVTADMLDMFGGTTPVNFSSTSSVMSIDATSKMIADNYSQMFTVTAVGE